MKKIIALISIVFFGCQSETSYELNDNTNNDVGNFPRCNLDSDCEAGCCRVLPDGSGRYCLDPAKYVQRCGQYPVTDPPDQPGYNCPLENQVFGFCQCISSVWVRVDLNPR